jgi:GT2 family glycosyltransferase
VTVTFNSAGQLKKFWSNAPTGLFNWIVIDNHTQDESVQIANYLGATKVIQLNSNLGFSKACNLGLRETWTEFVGFVNPDLTVSEPGLIQILTHLEKQNSLVSQQLINEDGSLQPNGRGLPYLNHKLVGRISPSLGRKLGYYRPKASEFLLDVQWLMGASVFGRTSTFRKLGGWDESFFLYYEDAALGIAARHIGVPSTLVGTEKWVHGWSRSTSSLNIRAWWHEIRSALAFYRKHPQYLTSWPKRK